VITAKVDTSKFEKLKDKKLKEYQKAVMKADEVFVEEFVSNTALRIRHQHRG
jgi:flagellar FliJ protein